MSYSLIMFDVGGTLVRWGEPSLFARFLLEHSGAADPEKLAADSALLRDLMIQTFNRNRHAAVGIGATDETVLAFWRRVLAETLDLWQHPEYGHAILEPLAQAVVMGEFDTPFEDAADALQQLRRSGYRLGVVSNWNQNLSAELSKWDLDRFFEFVVVSSLVGVSKPSPDIFHIALEKARCRPRDALYVGDNVADDCAGARKAGLDVALIDRAGTGPEDRPPCTAVYPDLKSLTGRLLTGGRLP